MRRQSRVPDECSERCERNESPGPRHRRRAKANPLAVVPIHDVKQRSVLRSHSALLRPGFVLVIASTSQETQRRGVGGAPTGALFHLSRLRDATIRASEARRVP
jgi:hypothetical protein